MKAIERTLNKVLHSGDQYLIPAFQRYYSWKQENWTKLWDDILDLHEEEQPTKTHFLGSIVCMPTKHLPGVVPAYSVIDGQQRLVTLSLFLCAIRDLARNDGQKELADEIHENYLIHRHKLGQELYKVFLRLRDRGSYLSILDATAPPQGLGESQVRAAYQFFRDRISAGQEDGQPFDLRGLFVTISDRLDFVLISLEGDSPFKIFKSLNSTGVPLEEADLIRNYVFMQVDLESMDAFDDDYWRPMEKLFESNGVLDATLVSGFLRDFLMRNGTYVRKDGAADAFEEEFPYGGFDPKDLVKNLQRAAEHYHILLGRSSHPSSRVGDALKKLRELQVGTANPLVLDLLDARAGSALEEADCVSATEAISGFVLRRYVCNESSRGYGRWFAAACSKFRDEGIKGIREFLKKKGWPDDSRFVPALVGFNLYGSAYGSIVLRYLEEAIPHKERANLAGTSIEHVMPQTLSQEWVDMLGPDSEEIHGMWLHTLGNLTLSAYNPELYNHPFDKKKEVFESSNVQLNKYFLDKSKWTATDIEERGRTLAADATKIFAGPSA